jgi:hypothetical protein
VRKAIPTWQWSNKNGNQHFSELTAKQRNSIKNKKIACTAILFCV